MSKSKSKERRDPTETLRHRKTAGSWVKAWLSVKHGADEEIVHIRDAPLIIGNAIAADLNLADPYVSAAHAELKRTPRGIQIRDLGSRNGTFVQGLAISEALLESSAKIVVGNTTLRFEVEGRFDRPESEAAEGRFGDALASSDSMRQLFQVLERVAPSDLTITILGETGTGKDVLARAVHQNSPREGGPFVVFDCGAAAPSLIESQLFGHVRGAFTGAINDHKGAFERADGGTLFLDEIGELSLELQPKLLRALEQRRVHPIGSQDDRGFNVRIIAATHRDLEAEVKQGQFRQDLFFRLNAALVRVPPLRDRLEDLPQLAELFAMEHGDSSLAPEAMDLLRAHDWPGNIRELRNVIAGAVAIASSPVLGVEDLVNLRPVQRDPTLERVPLAGFSLEEIERNAIAQTMNKCEGNKTKAAKMLGIATSTLYEKLKKLKI